MEAAGGMERKEGGWGREDMEEVEFEQQKASKDYGGSKNIVLGNTKNQTSGTKTETEKDLQNLNTGETSFNDLFSRTSI